jgi:hypothetical protein
MHLSALGSPGHTARLAAVAGVALPGQSRRVLAFQAAHPTATNLLLYFAQAQPKAGWCCAFTAPGGYFQS